MGYLYSLSAIEGIRKWLDAEEKDLREKRSTPDKTYYRFIGGYIYIFTVYKIYCSTHWGLTRAPQGEEEESLGYPVADSMIGWAVDCPPEIKEWVEKKLDQFDTSN